MSDIGSIRKLVSRRIRPGNPQWVNEALKLQREHVGLRQDGTYFGKNYSAIDGIMRRYLPRLVAASPFVRVLDIGIGAAPHPEVFEVKNMLMRSGAAHHVSVMDVHRETLADLSRMKRLDIEPRYLDKTPDTYREHFLGRSFVKEPSATPLTIFHREGYVYCLDIPDDVLREMTLIEGDVVTAKLPPGGYDLIFCLRILPNYNGQLKQLALFNLARGLRAGGILVTEIGSDPERWSWCTRERLAELGLKRDDTPLKFDATYGEGDYALERI